MKNALIISLSLFLLLIAGLLFSYYLKKQPKQFSSVLEAVPTSSAIIVRAGSYSAFIETLTQNSQMWQELTGINSVGHLNNTIFTLDSLARQHLDAGDYLLSREFCLAASNTGAKDFGFLFIVALGAEKGEEYVREIIKSAIKPDSEPQKRIYNSTQILSIGVMLSGEEKQLHIAIEGQLFIASFSPFLVENSIRQLHSGQSLLDDNDFQRIHSTAGRNVDCNVYANYALLPKLVSCLLSDPAAGTLESWAQLGSWAEWDGNLKNKGLLLTGFSNYSKISPNFFSSFASQSPVRMSITEILPASTSFFISIGISDAEAFKRDYFNFTLSTPKGNTLTESAASVNKLFGADMADAIYGLLKQEAALVYTDAPEESAKENCFAVFQVKSKKMAEDAMLGLLENYAKMNGIELRDITEIIKIDRESEFAAYRMPEDYIPAKLFGGIFAPAPSRYMSFLDNYIIFSSNLRSLEKFAHSHLLGTDMDHDSNFGQFRDHLSKNYSVFVYGHLEKGSHLFSSILGPSYKKDWMQNAGTINKFQAFAGQYLSSQKMMYSNIFLYFNPQADERPRTVWESRLDTVSNFKPKLVETHITSGREILVQDATNNVYMINKAGRVLWKQNIKEPINSDIYHIDYYGNGKIQYVFSTASAIFVIDRLGNYVDRFPIMLRAKSTAGVTVIDYDSKKDYRFAIPCADKKVYMYSKEGRLVQGWEFSGTDNEVLQAVEHFSHQGRDYIVFADRYNSYILDRRGKHRVKADKKFEKAENSSFGFDASGGSPRFVTTDIKGRIASINIDGKTEFTEFGEFTAGHFFEFYDIDGDGRKDYIFIDGNKLSVFRFDGSRVFEHIFKNPIEHRPAPYFFSRADVKIGVTDAAADEIYLFNNNGSIYKGFPLRGSSQFSIGVLSGGQGRFNLLVGRSNFLYNYRVN
jgi:hypothetical protein